MDMENFREIMVLREQFAQNREKNKLEFREFEFDKREDIMDKNFGLKKDFLAEEDKYHEKRHGRKMTEIKAARLC